VFIEKNNFEKKKNGKHQISLNKMEEVKHGFKRERRKIQKQHQIIHKLYIEQQMRKLEERNYICKENKYISENVEGRSLIYHGRDGLSVGVSFCYYCRAELNDGSN
jgi:metal-dependent hydrolase (beta-lactamase superfamily II)